MIHQGEVYWLHFGAVEGSAPSGRRPAVVVQHDRFNRSTVSTIVVVAVTSNLRLGAMPGNVRLRRGDAGLAKASVINVSQIRTVDRDRLAERIGNLTTPQLREVLQGLSLVLGTDDLQADRP